MLGIIDDQYPFGSSGFRMAEFAYYLKKSKAIKIYSSNLGYVAHPKKSSKISKKAGRNNIDDHKVFQNLNQIPPMDSYYAIFINNAMIAAQLAERDNVPFSFTLYPGGGFLLNDHNSYEMLRYLIHHSRLHTVIATQPETLKVLAELGCDPRKIKYIFGSVTYLPKRFFKMRGLMNLGKKNNICFASHRYAFDGTDKGIDIFIQACDELITREFDIRVHIVGPWSELVKELSRFPERYKIYDLMSFKELSRFFEKMQIAIFPTRANIPFQGKFDGFPLATMVQATLAGCLSMSTNPLGQVTPIVNRDSFIEIQANSERLWESLEFLIENKRLRRRIAAKGKATFLSLYSTEKQLRSRLQILESMIGN
jgi:glycosyltransferase involved in cell wall biosynthesis